MPVELTRAPMLAFVMPIHRDHFGFAQLFFRSLGWCGADEGASFFPTFASDADQTTFLANIHTARIRQENTRTPLQPLVVPPDPRNPSTSQKWHAVHRVFSEHLSIRYAMTLDAETAMIGAADTGNLFEWMSNWSTHRLVFGSNWVPKVCAIAGIVFFRRSTPVGGRA